MKYLKQAIEHIRAAQRDCRTQCYVQALMNHEAAIAAIERHIEQMERDDKKVTEDAE